MIRDVTGLNEARDASNPDKNSLVGLQKLAAANSNVATRHILQGSLYLTLRMCENISLRIADSLQFALTKDALQSSISNYNVGTLDELAELNIHDFGIFIELTPDDEEKAVLEQNIQIALKTQSIFLEDAIDIREVKNLKLANQLLKFRRKKKQERDEKIKLENIQAQAQANAQTAEKAALAEMQKQQALAETTLQIETGKSQLEIQKMQLDAEIKKQMMELQYTFDMQLATIQVDKEKTREEFIEDRKDRRARIQGTQQSEMISQRKNDMPPKDFEQQEIGIDDFMP
tara:strand:- start:1179 stop:2042 length:864 start_codon:yes stop_codon:yes gene_type:complete